MAFAMGRPWCHPESSGGLVRQPPPPRSGGGTGANATNQASICPVPVWAVPVLPATATPGMRAATPVPFGLLTTESIKVVSFLAVDGEVAVSQGLGRRGLNGLALGAGHRVEQVRRHDHAPVGDRSGIQGDGKGRGLDTLLTYGRFG